MENLTRSKLGANLLIGLGYYTICSYNKLLTNELLQSQLAMQTISNFSYTIIHARWGSSKKLEAIDILPILLILCTKTQEVSWKTQLLITAILAGPQIAMTKTLSSAQSSPPSPQPQVETHYALGKNDWLWAHQISEYYFHLQPKYPQAFFYAQAVYVPGTLLQDIQKIIEIQTELLSMKSPGEVFLTKKTRIFLPLIYKSHSVLVHINLTKRTVEYFDSLQDHGRPPIENDLQDCADWFSKQLPSNHPFTCERKIKKKLQDDSYQCAVWLLYFTEKLLENPDVDFNALEIQPAQKMIAEFRKEVAKYCTPPTS